VALPLAANQHRLLPSHAMLLLYATHDGQARRIATRIAARLADCGFEATPRDLADGAPTGAEIGAAPLVVLVAAVRYGRHLPQAERFLATYRRASPQSPLAFISVNLTARKPGKNNATHNAYLRKSIRRHGLVPVLAQAVAGRLAYPHYRWWDRQIIRLIMTLTGGPADPRTCTEFTDWAEVDAIATRIVALLDGIH